MNPFIFPVLAMVRYCLGLYWIPGLSSASSFDSDCSPEYSHRGFLLPNMGWSSLSVPIPVPSRKWLKRFVTTSVLFQLQISVIDLGSVPFSWWSLFEIYGSKTKMGKAMRAVSVIVMPLQLMGINCKTVRSAFYSCFGISLGGAGGVLIGLYYNSRSSLWWTTTDCAFGL